MWHFIISTPLSKVLSKLMGFALTCTYRKMLEALLTSIQLPRGSTAAIRLRRACRSVTVASGLHIRCIRGHQVTCRGLSPSPEQPHQEMALSSYLMIWGWKYYIRTLLLFCSLIMNNFQVSNCLLSRIWKLCFTLKSN